MGTKPHRAVSCRGKVEENFRIPGEIVGSVDSTVLTRISAAAPIKFFALQVLRLIEGGTYLKNGPNKEILAYLQSVRKNQLVTEASFCCHHSPLSALFRGVFTQFRSHSPLLQQPFLEERHFQCGLTFFIVVFKLNGIP